MSDTLEIENKYNTESLDFINSYKTYFSPLLASIAATLNNNSDIIATLKTMTTTQNSNLKELIVKLKEMKDIGGNKARPISHNGDYSKYVAQCLRLIQLQHSKEQRHSLFSSVMRDMKANPKLMDQLKTLKASTDWTEWKKMVGMLIPEGADVKILTTVIEPSTRLKLSNKFTAISGKEITGTVVKRAKLTGRAYGGEFKKLVKLQEDLIRNKGDNNVEFSPEHIQLIKTEAAVPVVTENFVSSPGTGASGPPVGTGTAVEKGKGTAVEAEAGAAETVAAVEEGKGTAVEAEAGAAETVAAVEEGKGKGEAGAVVEEGTVEAATETGEATGATGEAGAVVAAVVAAQHELQLQKGGSQRLTRKNTKTMGTARKTRTNH